MKFFGAVGAFAWTFLLAAAMPVFASPFSGLTITSIGIQDDQGKPWPGPETIVPLMVVQPRTAFSGENIREGISYLYLTGKFKDIRVDGFPDKDGVRLVYTLFPVTRVSAIEISGNRALSRSTLFDAIKGVEGRELREDRFHDLRTVIQTRYQSEGYYGAVVAIATRPGRVPHEAVLSVSIQEPNRTVVGDVIFSGNTVFSKRKLLRVIKNRPGKPLRTDVLFDQDMAAIVEKYTEAGYPAAKPGPVDISFRGEQAFILVSGSEGPKVTVLFSGNHAFSDSDLEEQILVWSEHDISDAILDGSADNIRDVYKADGYDAVKVTVKKAEGPGRLDVTFQIQEGPRITVKKIAISGNASFRTKQLMKEMSLREPGWFFASPFRQDLLDSDLEAIRSRYLQDGFLAVDVKKTVELIDGGEHAVVLVEIVEGPQTDTGSVQFEGNKAFTDEELLDRLNLKPGMPFNERLIDEDRYRILSSYSDRGYLYARVEADRKPSDESVNITYRITEDRPVMIGKVILRGNETTKEGAVRRELLLKPGDAYHYEKILKSQQRLYRFGYFNVARFEPVNPGEKEYVKDMLLTLDERPAGSFEVGRGVRRPGPVARFLRGVAPEPLGHCPLRRSAVREERHPDAVDPELPAPVVLRV